MKILGISGSPRADGNTADLVKKALATAEDLGAETAYVSLAGKKIGYCNNCNHCVESNNYVCPLNDDVKAILDEMASAEAMIIGSPTYFAAVSGQLKTLFDRTIPLRRDGFKLSGKVGGAIAVGGSRNGGQEHVLAEIQNFMMLHEMIVVADKKTAHFGGIAMARGPGDALNDGTGLATVENLALNVFETCARLKGKDDNE